MRKKMPSKRRLALGIRVKILMDLVDKKSTIIDKKQHKLKLKYAIKKIVLNEYINVGFETKEDMYKFTSDIIGDFIYRGGDPFMPLHALH